MTAVTVIALLATVGVLIALVVRTTRPDPAFDELVAELARRAAIQRIVETGRRQSTTLWEQVSAGDIGAPGRCIREMCYREVDGHSDSFCTFHLTLLRKGVV